MCDEVGGVGITQDLEAGVHLCDDAAREGAQTPVLRPEGMRGVGFGEELGNRERVVDYCVGEGGDGEDWDPAGRGRFDL